MRHSTLVVLFGALVPALPSLGQSAITATPSRSDEIRELRQELQRISARLNVLESSSGPSAASSPAESSAPPKAASDVVPTPLEPTAHAAAQSPVLDDGTLLQKEDARTLSFFRGTTLSFGFDGYYGYNFNQPVGRVNLLRVYDVSSNSFSINQANVIVEHLPTSAERFGGRLDLQYGQATEALQGSSANEQRPQVYRNVFQAYGSYLAPVGSGLQIDFGKFASSLGNEGNYTKDQIAYSRSYSFGFLPYYHMGLRANYAFTPKVNLTYWLVNGTQQTEDFNGFKSQGFILNLKPVSTLSWNVNYYFGQEQRDVEATLNPGVPTAPTQPGLPTTNITPSPNGREHIFDTYATWNATKQLTLVGEADFVLNRTNSQSQPARVAIGSLAAKYVLPRNWSVGGRFEYFDDRGGLFSGSTQALKEFTFVADHTFAPGFLARAEYRKDFSNQRFFLTEVPGVLSHGQTTATLGLVYWWGMKQGSW